MNYNIQLEVLSPVHVGMGNEKKLVKGLDFTYEKGAYKIFNQNKILSAVDQKDVFAISGYMADGNYDEFTRYLTSKNLLSSASIEYEWKTAYSRAFEIRSAFKDGAGKYFIPGSSIKGALRSIIGTALWNAKPGDINYNAIMGEKIDNNLMRFLHITDCYLNSKPGIFPVKVFSADKQNGEKFGAWKDRSRGGHEERFNAENFVTYYEMLTDELSGHATTGTFRINWGVNEFVRSRKAGNVPNINIFANPSIEWLWNKIKTNTDEFLKAEMDFFDTYPNNALDDYFFDEITWLREENTKDENACVIRLGANVGWHSITGNWKFDDYSRAVETNRGKKIEYKTRKLGFNGIGDDRRFFLPGFVKLKLT